MKIVLACKVAVVIVSFKNNVIKSKKKKVNSRRLVLPNFFMYIRKDQISAWKSLSFCSFSLVKLFGVFFFTFSSFQNLKFQLA